MTIYFAGTSVADLSGATSGVVATTNSAQASTAVCREGINVPSGDLAYIDLPSGLSDFWVVMRLAVTSTTNTGIPIQFFDTTTSQSQAIFRLNKSGSNWNTASGLLSQYWNGSSWVTYSTFTGSNSITTLAFYFKIADSGGEITTYYAGSNAGSLTGDTKLTTSSTVNRIQLSSGGNSNIYYSEIIVADVDVRDYRLATLYPTGNGANTAWTNDYTAVDETGRDDTDYISGAANGDIETYTMSDIDSSVSTADVEALVVSMRARKGGSGPQNLQAALRISGSDYASASVSGLTTAFGPTQAVFTTNPATSSNWSQAQVNGAEIGVKAIT